MLAHVFADAVADHHRIVDRVPGDGQERGDDGKIDLVVGHHQGSHRDQHVVDQRDDGAQPEAQLEPEPDIRAHHDRGENDRQDAPAPEVVTDLGAYGFHPQHFVSARAERVVENVPDVPADGADLGAGLLHADQILARVAATEVLHHAAQRRLLQGAPQLSDGHGVRELHVHHGAAFEIDAKIRALGEQQQHHADDEHRRQHKAPSAIAQERYLGSRLDDFHSLRTLLSCAYPEPGSGSGAGGFETRPCISSWGLGGVAPVEQGLPRRRA